MTFQASPVKAVTGFGVQGEIQQTSPYIAQSYVLNSALASYNVMGSAFSVVSEGVAAAGNAGGTAVFAGYLSGPKEQALYGTGGNPLAPSLVLPNNVSAGLVTMGIMIVYLPAAAAIGDWVVYDNVTGLLSTIAPNAALPVGKSAGFATVYQYTVTGAGLALIQVNPYNPRPVLAA
jgi:hypothetical protein